MSSRPWTADEVRSLGVRTDLVTAGSVLGLGRTVAHQHARRGTFPVPVLRLGGRYVVPVAPLLALLGLDDETDAAAEPTSCDTRVTPPAATCGNRPSSG